ncbi:MAG TPA: hypothetical protein DEH78_24440 [Solibacterales bacterium]|nr:hypothetical protein [Bryobacterales bacterium]
MALLQILAAQDPADRAVWLEAWRRWPSREVFAHPDYVRLHETGSARAFCALWEEGPATVLYSFLLRDLSTEPWFEPGAPRAYDIATAYGYGGPHTWGAEPSAELRASFDKAFRSWALERRVVSEFIRYSLFGHTLLPPDPDTTALVGPHVVVGPELDPDVLWPAFAHKVRKNVNRARTCGVTIETEETGSRLDEFLAIYAQTMERRNAGPEYLFPRSFFESLNADLRGQFCYFFAVKDGRTVSVELILVSAEAGYSFLGGSDLSAAAARPNDLLKVEALRWCSRRGLKWFVMGGGFKPDDGIFRYKLAFAPSGTLPYVQGRRVLVPDLYHQFTQRNAEIVNPGAETPGRSFFPAYRRV